MSRARRARARRQDLVGSIVIAMLAIAAAAGGTWWWRHNGSEARDAIGCLESADYDRLSILVDRSDALTPLQKRGVRQWVEMAVDDAAPGTRITLHALEPDHPLLVQTLFDGCRPPDGTSANRLTQNERRLCTRWREEFEKPLQTLLEATLEDASASTSPLLEAIQSVAVQDFSTFRTPDRLRRLLIVSDMLQHTAGYSHYRDDPLDYAGFASLPYARGVRASLDNVDVEIAYVGRTQHAERQTIAHGLFWEGHVEANGGRLQSIRRVTGGPS